MFSLKLIILCLVYFLVFVECSGIENATNNEIKAHSDFNIDDVLNVFEPQYLMHIWNDEGNGKERLSPGCAKDVQAYLQGIANAKSWAIKMVDATGRYNRGLFWGNRYWIGSADLCRDLDLAHREFMRNSGVKSLSVISYRDALSVQVEVTEKRHHYQYPAAPPRDGTDELRKSNITDAPPMRVVYSSVVFRIDIMAASLLGKQIITLGICLPRACNETDVKMLLKMSSTRPEDETNNKQSTNVEVLKVRVLYGNYNYFYDPKFYILICVSTIVTLLMIFGTIIDIKLKKREKFEKENGFLTKLNGLTQNGQNTTNINMDNVESATINNNNLNLVKVKKNIDDKDSSALDISAMKSNGNNISSIPSSSSSEDDLAILNHNVVGISAPQSLAPEPIAISKHIHHKNSLLVDIVLAFSVTTNLSKIFSLSVGKDSLAPIHGLKLISLMWVIMVHTCLIVFQVSDNKIYRAKAENDFLYQTLSNGTYSVDTFFFLSGFLLSFLYCRTLTKYNCQQLIKKDGVLGQIVLYISIICYRFIRLTPPYLMVLGLIELSMKWYHDHSVTELPSRDYINCERYWWRNALYINTYYPLRDRCMTWSWYLSCDAQFYTFGVLLLMLTMKYVRLAAAAVAFFLISAWCTTAVISVHADFTPSIKDPFAHYDALYDKPWTRIGPYLIGMCCGWYLCHINVSTARGKPFKIPRIVKCIGWTLSLSCMISIVYGLYYENPLPRWIGVAYISLSHTAWAVALGFIMIACVTGQGGIVNSILSYKYLFPLSRLSYCAYLVHPALMRSVVLHADSAIHITEDMMALLFLGFFTASYMVSFILSLAFEAPAVSLLRLINPTRKKIL